MGGRHVEPLYLKQLNSSKLSLGDEHFVSDDSNRFGPVIYLFPPFELYDLNCLFLKISAGLIESKLVTLIWPLHRFGHLKKPSELQRQFAIDELKKEQARHLRIKIGTGNGFSI